MILLNPLLARSPNETRGAFRSRALKGGRSGLIIRVSIGHFRVSAVYRWKARSRGKQTTVKYFCD